MNKKLPEDFVYLPEMYSDTFFPTFLVDKLKGLIQEVVTFIEEGNHTVAEIQESLDRMTIQINNLQDEFEDNDSEIETVARDAIGTTVERLLKYFEIGIDAEEAIRERDW